MKRWIDSSLKDSLHKAHQLSQATSFVYDLDEMSRHLESLNSLGVKLFYAVKSNPLSSLLKVMERLNWSFDVASSGERDHVLNQGISSEKVIVTGPAKSRKFLRECLEKGIETFVIESESQAIDLADLASEMKRCPKVLLRLQMSWENTEASVLGGNEITPFGLDEQTWQNFDFSKLNDLEILGWHVFQWGNVTEADKLKSIWKAIGDKTSELSQSLGIKPKILDLGGGLGIPYQGEEVELNIESLPSFFQEFKQEYKLDEVWMELGRFATGPFGYYVTPVIDKKVTRGKELLVLEGGTHHLVRKALTDVSFPAELLRDSNAAKKSYSVHGPLCTALDHMGDFELPEDIQVGDLLVFAQCGAYGFTESMPFFLCHDLPAEIIKHNQKLEVIRPSVSAQEWLR